LQIKTYFKVLKYLSSAAVILLNPYLVVKDAALNNHIV